jgi:pSer/pThr/pTyr-binding forkhead associated (FHA) protein
MPQLCLVDARGEEHAYPIVDDVVPVGRGPSNRIVLTDRSVSRLHFLLRRFGSEYLIQDVGSRYGTFVNGRRLTHSVMLRSGNLIEVGNHRILYSKAAVPYRLPNPDDIVEKVHSRGLGRERPAPLISRRKRTFRIRFWWRLSSQWLAFGWKTYRK